MNGPQRKGGTMLTAQEVAAIAGGAAIGEPVEVIEADYPRNPASPVTTEFAPTKFNTK